MKTFTAVVERSPETGLFVGFIPGFPGAHTQGESLDELNTNLREVLAMLLEDGEPQIEAEFIDTQLVKVGYQIRRTTPRIWPCRSRRVATPSNHACHVARRHRVYAMFGRDLVHFVNRVTEVVPP